MFHSVQSYGVHWTLDCWYWYNICCNPVNIPEEFSGLHWTPLDWNWTGTGLWKVACSPVGVQWTGLDWTAVDQALYQPIWPGKRVTGIHWSPLESTGVYMDYMREGKDLTCTKEKSDQKGWKWQAKKPRWLFQKSCMLSQDMKVVAEEGLGNTIHA